MYKLIHKGDSIGNSLLERGDPEAFTASGVFNNMGGAKALSGWIKSVGGEEDKGVVFIELNEDFELVGEDGNKLNFSDAHLIAVPDEDETYLDISLSKEDYNTHFAEHISALDNE